MSDTLNLLLSGDVTAFLFSSEKIFTVLTVVLIIFSGLGLYLWNLDRKISKLEKKNQDTDKK